MKRLPAVVLIVLLTAAKVQSQDVAIGLKFGITSGISIKMPNNYSDQKKGELILGASWGGYEIKALHEVYYSAFGVENLEWYYGAGFHMGFWNRFKRGPWENKSESTIGLGIDGILGMVYRIPDIPFEVSFDLIPVFNLVEHTAFWMDGGFGIRYVF